MANLDIKFVKVIQKNNFGIIFNFKLLFIPIIIIIIPIIILIPNNFGIIIIIPKIIFGIIF